MSLYNFAYKSRVIKKGMNFSNVLIYNHIRLQGRFIILSTYDYSTKALIEQDL